MKFAAKLDAEPGWKAILSKEDGEISIIDIEEWGIAYERGVAMLIPLDHTTGLNIMKRKNFIRLIDPNDNLDLEKLKHDRAKVVKRKLADLLDRSPR